MDFGYSALFTSGLRQPSSPRRVSPSVRPQRLNLSTPSTSSSSSSSSLSSQQAQLTPSIAITTVVPPSPEPSRPKIGRRRRSSMTLATNPLAALKSPTRNAKNALMSPVRENLGNGKRFFDFGTGALGNAVKLLRNRKNKVAEQKPAPSAPLPPLPSTPSRSRSYSRNTAIQPPSSPTAPDSFSIIPPSKQLGTGKKSLRLRLTPPDILPIMRRPLSPSSYWSNGSSPITSGGTPGLSPAFSTAYSAGPQTNVVQTPSTGLTYFDWNAVNMAMDGLIKEENVEDLQDPDDTLMMF